MSGYYSWGVSGGATYTPLTAANYIDVDVVEAGLQAGTVDMLAKSPYVVGDRNEILKAALKEEGDKPRPDLTGVVDDVEGEGGGYIDCREYDGGEGEGEGEGFDSPYSRNYDTPAIDGGGGDLGGDLGGDVDINSYFEASY